MKNKFKSTVLGLFLTLMSVIMLAFLSFPASANTSCYLEGIVLYNGSGSIYGYTDNYVLYGGSQETQHRVYDGWHVTAYASHYSRGVTWYQCWDSDDGDYYGWIDSSYLFFPSPRESSSKDVTSYSIEPTRYYINTTDVYGYTDNYALCTSGSQEVQKKTKKGWHVTAYNTAYSHGVTWYECWDSDDGDYYGWIDSSFLSFYVETASPPVVVTVTVPVVVTVTQVVEETIVVTVTEPREELVTEMTELEAVPLDAIIDDNGGDLIPDVDSKMLIIIVAIVIVIIIALIVLLLVMIGKKPHSNKKSSDMSYNNYDRTPYEPYDSFQEIPGFCENCGAKKTDPEAVFCSKCGNPYNRQ